MLMTCNDYKTKPAINDLVGGNVMIRNHICFLFFSSCFKTLSYLSTDFLILSIKRVRYKTRDWSFETARYFPATVRADLCIAGKSSTITWFVMQSFFTIICLSKREKETGKTNGNDFELRGWWSKHRQLSKCIIY